MDKLGFSGAEHRPATPAHSPPTLRVFPPRGLAAARSHRGSDSPPDCHSLPRCRFATPRGRHGAKTLGDDELGFIGMFENCKRF